MPKGVLMLGLVAAVLCATPVLAVTPQEKAKTCEIGAKDQKLKGKARADFIKKCLADEDSSSGSANPPKGQ